VASINFVTAHDGFTLRDLVSYNEKHNDANGEDGNDGESHNRSWNSGVEGETDDPEVLALRARRQRSFLATLFLSQGVPMLLHGDELGRTQQGNNNVYAQDSELSWIDWSTADGDLMTFTASVARLRREHPVFRRVRFFTGRPVKSAEGDPRPDVEWLLPDARPMTDEDWDTDFVRSVGVFLNGRGIRARDARGEPVVDDDFVVYFNADGGTVPVVLPAANEEGAWVVEIDTAEEAHPVEGYSTGDSFELAPHSVVVLRSEPTA
jgi:glycogen operon protein